VVEARRPTTPVATPATARPVKALSAAAARTAAPPPKASVKTSTSGKNAKGVKAAAAVATRPPRPVAARPVTPKTPTAKRAGAPRRTRSGSGGWSRTALRDLGLPEAVLAGLPATDPTDDLAWVAALASAIEAVLPAPVRLGAAHPVAVDGYGVAGALALIHAAACGLPPGTLTVGERTAPATATELALVLRSAVVGWSS
ncbi:MAG: hypothetical protein WCD35_07240, partial [Mycobacteriales bacterium]